MKFQITASALSQELEFLKTVSKKNAAIPALRNVLIEPCSNFIRLATTDLETFCESTIQAEVAEPSGGIPVNARMLARIVRQFSENDILVFSTSKSAIEIRNRDTRYKIPTLPLSDSYPRISEDNYLLQTRIPAPVLLRLIKHTIRIFTKEESRYSLNSALMESHKDTLRMVSTDGHRLAVASEQVDCSVPQSLIPRRALKALLTTLLDAGDVLFSRNDKHLSFRFDNRLITSLVSFGKFPEWQRVVPDNKRTVIINACEFLAALKRIKICTIVNATAVSLLFEGSKVTLSAGIDSDWGVAKVVVPLVSSNHKLNAFNIAFNIKYLKDVLVEMSGDLRMELPEDNFDPVLIRSIDRPTYKTAIMPVRLL